MGLLDFVEGASLKVLNPSGGCHVCERRRKGFVPATLTTGRVLFIGEAPGAEEAKQGEGFVGPSGQLLRQHIARVGIADPSFTNAIHCRPPNNRNPKPREIECCLSQMVLDEIRSYPIVVLVGAVPLQALFPKAVASHFRGNVAYHPDFPNQRFYAIYHPAYILRRKDKESDFRRQMERLGQIVAEEREVDWEIKDGSTSADFLPVLERILASPVVSLDLETSTLDSWDPRGRIKSFAVTADAKTVAFGEESDPTWALSLQKIREFLEKPEKHVVGQNTGFDVVWLEDQLNFRIRCRGIHDVSTIYYEAKQYRQPSLKELVSNELDGYRYLIWRPHREMNRRRLALYNAEDAIYTLLLFRKGMQLLKPKTREMVMHVSGPSSYLLRRITRNGLYLRRDYQQQKIEEYRQRRREVVEAWKADDPDFIPDTHESGAGLKDYLFKIKGLPVLAETEKNEPAVDRPVIKQWIRTHGATYLNHLLDLRSIDKIQSTYLTAYDKWIGVDGRIHPSYTNTFTDTIRSSSREPNVQNIPRKKEIRSLFGVPSGHILLESDFSQVEFRIMVCLAHDEAGIAGYLRGDDAHTMTARTFMIGETPTSEERSRAKTINFALLYKGDWYNVQKTARDWYDQDWPEAQCREFVSHFFELYSGIRTLHLQNERDLTTNRGWFTSVTGHTHYYKDWNHRNQDIRDHTLRAAINAQAQGPAAQICFLTGIETEYALQEHGLGAVRVMNTVHDSLMYDVPDPHMLDDVVGVIDEAKDKAYEWVKDWFIVPLVIEHEIGEDWGALEEYKKVA